MLRVQESQLPKMQSSGASAVTIIACFINLAGTFPVYRSEYFRAGSFYPEENVGVNIFLAEGDILVNREDVQMTFRQHPDVSSSLTSDLQRSRQKRSSEFQYFKTWYNRSVPYVFDHFFDEEAQNMVEAAIFEIQNSSCLQFRRRNNEKDFIRFMTPYSGCYSPVGRVGGVQDIGLGSGCLSVGIIQHEILHALGMWHEQSRWDRDEYIKVMWDNIPLEHHTNFGTRTLSQSHEVFLTMPYDYSSIMHYSNNTFAIDRHRPTLVPKQDLPKGVVMGQRAGLSRGDLDKINALYRCDIMNCTEPGTLANGQIEGTDFTVGASISYTCNEGYTLIGAPERVCRDVGEWSGQPPVCIVSDQGTLHYCNFEAGGSLSSLLCGWRQARDEELDWQNMTGPTPSDGTGPNWDHTLSTVYGGYMYIEASNRSPRQKARLVSPTFNSTSSRSCLVLFTYMYGTSMGNLSIFMNTSGSFNSSEANFLMSVRGDQGQQWKQIFLLLLNDGHPFTITLEGSVGNGFMSDIAVDDVVVGNCADFKPLALMGGLQETTECTFDTGLCQFLQDRRDNMDWDLYSGKTPTIGTGPECDPYDCRNGKYLYIESSRPRFMGNRARLRSPVLRGEGRRCLSFYYHMYGEHIGSLTITMFSLISGTQQILWSASGNQGNRWHSRHVDFMSAGTYEVYFDGTVGTSYKGDIAIDRASITLGRCTDSLQFDCNFEHDLCGWMNAPLPGGTLDWIRHTGETDSPDTGPLSDRTDPDGYYLYVESSRTVAGDVARLVSPTVPGSPGGYCLLFWYHMFGESSGNFTVSFQTDVGQEAILWNVFGDQGNQWRSRRVNITNVDGHSFNVIFEATMFGFTGDIAIDDLSIQNSLCGS